MIEDKKLDLKVAKDPKEAMIIQTIDKIKQDQAQMEFSMDINKQILKYLETKCQKTK